MENIKIGKIKKATAISTCNAGVGSFGLRNISLKWECLIVGETGKKTETKPEK